MYALYEFSNNTVEVGWMNYIEGDYEPDVDKEYVVWWPQNNGKRSAWTAKVLAIGGKLAYLTIAHSFNKRCLFVKI